MNYETFHRKCMWMRKTVLSEVLWTIKCLLKGEAIFFLKINFYPHTFTSHPPAATGITVLCTQNPVRPFDPWLHLHYPSAREWGQDTYQSGFLLNPPVSTEKESLKIKPCSFLCAQVFCLIDDMRKPGEKVVKSREQGKPTRTKKHKIFKCDWCFKAILLDSYGIFCQEGKPLLRTKLANI